MSKNLIFCFDGTSNHPRDAKQKRDWFGLSQKVVDKNITNILKLHVMFGGNLHNEFSCSKQRSFYYSGVGSNGTLFSKLLNSSLALENLDVKKIIKLAINDLLNHYKKGDQIFVFGFSRGAAIARRFSAVIHKYLGYEKEVPELIRFLGVFDTVASIGFPNLDDTRKPISDVVFENGTLSENIKSAVHLLSLDEQRVAFQPTLMNAESKVKEVWFSGTHSDIGGGYYNDGLSDVTLDYMINEIIERQMDLDILDVDEIDFDLLRTEEYAIKKENVFINVNYLGLSHKQKRWYPFSKMTLSQRCVRVNEDDEPSQRKLPLVYYSVKQRVQNMMDYQPLSLKNIEHYLEKNHCFIHIKDVDEYIVVDK